MTHSFLLLERRIRDDIMGCLPTEACLRPSGEWYVIRLGAMEFTRVVDGNWLS